MVPNDVTIGYHHIVSTTITGSGAATRRHPSRSVTSSTWPAQRTVRYFLFVWCWIDNFVRICSHSILARLKVHSSRIDVFQGKWGCLSMKGYWWSWGDEGWRRSRKWSGRIVCRDSIFCIVGSVGSVNTWNENKEKMIDVLVWIQNGALWKSNI